MENSPLELAGRPLWETRTRRAWSDARPAELLWTVGGAVFVAGLTIVTVLLDVFEQPQDLGDALLYVGVSAAGALLSGFALFMWHLSRATSRQRNEARVAREKFMTDRVSQAIGKLDGVQLARGLSATGALLLLKNELIHGIARHNLAKRVSTVTGEDVEPTTLITALTDAGVIEISSTTTRPFCLSSLGHDVCWRLHALGREVPVEHTSH